MVTPLPSKDMVLRACAGTVAVPHPVLLAAYELASLHEARVDVSVEMLSEIDRARELLVHDIDCWVAQNRPQPLGAAYLHTESVGTVVDRLARFSVAAHTALDHGVAEPRLHFLWQRLAELALAYTDLAFEISAGRRKLPDCTHPPAPHESTEQERQDERHRHR
jgi:hypothetical protein